MKTYIAIHKHRFGTAVRVFNSEHDAPAIFASLPEFCGTGEQLDQEDFARHINIAFNALDENEHLKIQELTAGSDVVDLSDFID